MSIFRGTTIAQRQPVLAWVREHGVDPRDLRVEDPWTIDGDAVIFHVWPGDGSGVRPWRSVRRGGVTTEVPDTIPTRVPMLRPPPELGG